MSNPILIFLNLRKFGKPDGWRKGVKLDGAIEDIVLNTQYTLILLGDQDSFDGLAFQHDRGQAILGVEHGSRPISGTRKAALTAICGRYEHVYTFRHEPENDIFEFMQDLFSSRDHTQRQNTVVKIITSIKSRDRWNGLLHFLMNEQIFHLGGKKLEFTELPRSAVEFRNKQEEGASYALIIEEFLASIPSHRR